MPTKISPCLWFDHQAEDATRFYTAIFKDSKIIAISRYPEVGWLKDKFGLSWQIVPKVLPALLTDPDTSKSQRAFQAMMQMKKLDIERLQRAFAG